MLNAALSINVGFGLQLIAPQANLAQHEGAKHE
jgi:hypothetical protein